MQNKTLKSIETELKRLGFYVDLDDDDDYDIYDEDFQPSYTLYFQSAKKRDTNNDRFINQISFNPNKQIPYCCGIQELGDLELSQTRPNPNDRKGAILLIQYAFIKTKELLTRNNRGKVKTAKALIMASNGMSGWILAEEALSGIPEHFKQVSTTRNGANGNIIKLFVGIY